MHESCPCSTEITFNFLCLIDNIHTTKLLNLKTGYCMDDSWFVMFIPALNSTCNGTPVTCTMTLSKLTKKIGKLNICNLCKFHQFVITSPDKVCGR